MEVATQGISRYLKLSFAEILSHVASNSITDLFNAKATCKLPSQFGSELYVLQNAAILDNYYWLRYRGEQHKADYSRFMTQCIDSENLEALFYLGIEDYFYGARDEGIKKLRSATDKGMKAAKYVCGILSLLVGNDVEKEEGLRLLEGLRKAKDVRVCRSMVMYSNESIPDKQEICLYIYKTKER